MTISAPPLVLSGVLQDRSRLARRLFIVWLTSLLLGLSPWQQALAVVIDRLDVDTKGDHSDITIRFAVKVIYLRHVMLDNGKELRIFIRPVDPAIHESDLDQEILFGLKTARVPQVRVVYPELVNSMLVTFSEETQPRVAPAADGQSIVISIPLRPLPPTTPLPLPILPVPASSPAPAVVAPVPVMPAPVSPVVHANTPVPPLAAPTVPVPSQIVPVPAVQAVAVTPPALPAPVVAVTAATPAPVFTQADVEESARKFMEQAKAAIEAKDPATAINRLNRILGMPTNAQTEAAQGLIGQAREMNGEVAKARAEYKLFLKLYPNSQLAAQVKERLAALPERDPPAKAPRLAKADLTEPVWTANGSLSSYYYHGNSQYDSIAPPGPGQIVVTQTSLSMVDEKSWINAINLNARRQSADSDTRIVFRDTDDHDYLNPYYSYNRLYSAYVDYKDLEYGYEVRAGRQNPTGMGVLYRFDGMQGSYDVGTDWRVGAVGGEAVEFASTFRRKFYGASIELLPQSPYPGLSLYALQQDVDNFVDRRSIGSELHYMDGGASAYGMLDYDQLYHGVNIALLQGNYLTAGGDTYFFILDHRKAPTYSLTNALPAFPGLSLEDMIRYQGIDAVRLQASNLTATSNLFALGMTHPFSADLQGGIDYRASSISSTGNVQAVVPLSVIGLCLGVVDPINNNCIINTASQPASGVDHVLSGQLVATNLLADNAVGIANLSLIKGPTFKGSASSLGYVLPFLQLSRLEANLRYYEQSDDSADRQSRMSYSLKLSHQWFDNLYIEGEAGHERDKSTGSTNIDNSIRNYFYVGLRADIH